jgi:uncharacterized membrane protein YebE (DUF533 family)
MVDMNNILGSLLGSGAVGGFAGGLAGGLTANALNSKQGRKLGVTALKVGGVAAVGALAYAAYQRYSTSRVQQQDAPQPTVRTQLAPPPPSSGFIPAPVDRDALGLTLVRAMIAAARADGTMDSAESQAIFGRIEQLGLSPDEQHALVAEMNRPVDMDELVSAATRPEIAAEIYLASLLAIDVDTPAEQGYLSMLAARLQLPRELVSELHRQAQAA